jgi:hypothetical protein
MVFGAEKMGETAANENGKVREGEQQTSLKSFAREITPRQSNDSSN